MDVQDGLAAAGMRLAERWSSQLQQAWFTSHLAGHTSVDSGPTGHKRMGSTITSLVF